MYHNKEDQRHEEMLELKGGVGALDFKHIVPPEQLYGAGAKFCEVSFKPGESIGLHGHTENFEVYYILEGKALVTDDDEERVLGPGDSEICANSHTHSIKNVGDGTLRIIALILNNFDRLNDK